MVLEESTVIDMKIKREDRRRRIGVMVHNVHVLASLFQLVPLRALLFVGINVPFNVENRFHVPFFSIKITER